MYDKLVAKVNNIDTSDFVLKITYNNDKTELENKIPNVTNFVKKTKLTELENKIPDNSNLATKTALNTVEKEIPDVSSLVKTTDFDTKLLSLNRKITLNKTKHLLVENELNNF